MNARTFLSGNTPGKFSTQASKPGKASIPSRARRRYHDPDRLTSKKLSQKRSVVWLDPQEHDRLLRKQSLSEANQGNYADAIAGLTILIDRNPENATDYNNRGLVHYQCGALDAALEDYNRAIELNPKLASAYNNRANYYATQGYLADAIADYETATDLDPTNVRAWINLGITFRDLEMYGEAIENFEHALQISQLLARDAEANRELEAHIYASRGRAHHLAGDWNFAVSDYRRALDRLSKLELTPAFKRLKMQVLQGLEELQA